jgi:LysR family nitrogen assimilation transcriptional regulator
MDFNQVRYLASALEHRSMSAGAKACGISQPSLSSQIKHIEVELDQILFARHSQGLQPTQTGLALYRRLSPILKMAEHGMRYLRAGETRPIEDVAVYISSSAVSGLYALVQQAACIVEANQPQIRIMQSGVEHGVPSRYGTHLVVRHGRRDKASVTNDRWFLVELRRKESEPDARRLNLGSIIDPLDIVVPEGGLREGMTSWHATKRRYVFTIVEGRADDRLAEILTTNRGRVLVPGLTASTLLLSHPRLKATPVDIGFPLGVKIEARGEKARSWRSPLAAAMRAATCRAVDDAPPSARQLRYFLRCADEGSITRAAAALNVVQPALTMQIRSLERNIGQSLFERGPQGVQLTPVGFQTRDLFRPLLAALEAHKTPMPKDRGVLHVGVLPGIDEYSLIVKATTAAVLAWQEDFPDVELKIVEAHSGVLLKWLVDKIIDVAIVEDLHTHARLNEQLLSSEPLSILKHCNDPVCAPGPIRMRDIPALNLVLPSSTHGLRALLERTFSNCGMVLAPKLQLDSMAAAISLVKGGNWVTVLPASAVRRSLAEGVLSAHPIVEPSIKRELRAVSLPSATNRGWAERFVMLLRDRLGSPV